MNKRKNDDVEDCEVEDSSLPVTASLDVDDKPEVMEEINIDTTERGTTAVMEILQDTAASQKFAEFPCQVPGCVQFFDTVLDYDTHYNMKHRHSCATCKKTLLSAHFLDLHILETHDSFFEVMAERRPMFSCYVDTCLEKFNNSKDRHYHGVEMHGYPKKFMYSQNPNKFHWQQQQGNKKGNQKKQTSKQHRNVQKTDEATSETNQMEVEEQSTSKASDKPKPETNSGTKPEPKNAPRLHISFGHRANKVFSRKHNFGMKPEVKAAETNMDLDKLKEALMEASPTEI